MDKGVMQIFAAVVPSPVTPGMSVLLSFCIVGRSALR
jgi:hypothetical protein